MFRHAAIYNCKKSLLKIVQAFFSKIIIYFFNFLFKENLFPLLYLRYFTSTPADCPYTMSASPRYLFIILLNISPQVGGV